MKIVVLNITHGSNPFLKRKHFLPIAAGACRDDITNDACGFDNISCKNQAYGDFSSLYWAWKNLSDVDIIGVSHYRRYILPYGLLCNHQYDVTFHRLKTIFFPWQTIKKELKRNDFIVPRCFLLNDTVKKHFIANHYHEENLGYVREALAKIHPECISSWDRYMEAKLFRPGYLFITTKEKFDHYCEWIYPVLEYLESKIDLSKYSGYQSRVIAYLYERLTPVYYETYCFKLKEYPMLFVREEPCTSLIRQDLHYRFKDML